MEMSDVRRAENWLERARELDGLENNLANLMSAVEYLIVAVKEQAETISRLERVELDRVYCAECDKEFGNREKYDLHNCV